MDAGTFSNFLIIGIPLIAGLALLGACAWVIISNPAISNRNVAMLGVGALLCMAPTLASFGLEFPGFKMTTALREQNGVIKDQVGSQGAELKRGLADLKLSIDAALKRMGAATPAPPDPDTARNRNSLVLIFYAEKRKEFAQKMEGTLLKQGFTANAIYTDFSELSEASRGKDGAIGIVYTQQNQELAEKIKKDLRTKFPAEMVRVNDQQAPKLTRSADVQILLF